MSGFGIHVKLALAGVVVGLPVAAVVQWRREPPTVVWSNTMLIYGMGSEQDAAAVDPWGPVQRFVTSPTGHQVTSIRACDSYGCGTVWSVETVAPFSRTAVAAVQRVWGPSPTRRRVKADYFGRVEADGVTWFPVTVSAHR